MSSKKFPIAINVFPTLDYVELVQLDPKTGQLEKAASLPCQFDLITRQVADRDILLQTIRDLYNMSRLPAKTPAVLVLPGFFTREIELPTEFRKDELRFALVSEAERFYLFKKSEPQIDWIHLSEGRLLYAAFPKSEIEKYQKVFEELQIPLLAIELSYFALLRGLVATGAVQEEIDSGAKWGLIVITDSTFFVSVQDGAQINRTTDAPLSTGGDETQNVVDEILQDYEVFIEDEQLTKLIVINNSTLPGLEDMLRRGHLHDHIIFIEQNATTLGSRGSVDAEYPCSLEGLGGVFYNHFPDMSALNFISDTGQDVAGIMHYRSEAVKWLGIANALLFILCLIIWGVFTLITISKDHEREEITQRASKMGSSLDAERLAEIKRKKFIKSVIDDNVMVNNFLVTLGTQVKDDAWLEKIEVVSPGFGQPPTVKLEGKTTGNLDAVNKLPGLLGETLKNAPLEVSNASQDNTDDGQTVFSWTIQNQGAAAPPNPSGGAH
jgi:hypothetical protein